MRKTFLMLSVAGLAAAALPSLGSAQVRPFQIGISGGPSIPTGDFDAEANTGYHVQGSVGFSVPMLPVGLRADLLWQEFPDEHEGNFREIGGMLNATLGLPLPLLKPYAIAGAGLVNHSAPEEDHGDHAHEGESGTTFGYNAGVGVQFGFLGLGGFLEARYLNTGEDHASFPITFGILF